MKIKQLYKSLSLLGIIAITGYSSTGVAFTKTAHDDRPEQKVEKESGLFDVVATSLTKQQVVYDYDEMLNFDIEQYLEKHAPHLLGQAEVISHYAGYSSISPKLLIALMEQESGVISNSIMKASIARPFGVLSSKVGFRAQVEDISSKLAMEFYRGHSFAETGTNEKLTTDQDAVKAIRAILAPKYRSNADKVMKSDETAHSKAV